MLPGDNSLVTAPPILHICGPLLIPCGDFSYLSEAPFVPSCLQECWVRVNLKHPQGGLRAFLPLGLSSLKRRGVATMSSISVLNGHLQHKLFFFKFLLVFPRMSNNIVLYTTSYLLHPTLHSSQNSQTVHYTIFIFWIVP